MKPLFFTVILMGLFSFSFGQSKAVKLVIDSTKIYFRYFYKSKFASDRTLNDSVHLVGRKITNDKFYLDKFVNKKKVWTRIYRIELAKDSLRITSLTRGQTIKNNFQYSKEPYYNSYYELPYANVTLDSILVTDTVKSYPILTTDTLNYVDKSSTDLFAWHKALVTYELINPCDVNLKWLPGISFPETKTCGIKLQVESFSDSLKKYIPVAFNDDILVAPKEIKIEILKPKTNVKRKEEMYFFTQLERTNRFRLIFKLSQYNKDISDCYSEWIYFPNSSHSK